MNLSEFLDLTPRQFFNAVNGFLEREETKLKESWEQTRLILAEIRSKPVYGYKIKPVVAKEMMPFPWEKESVKVDEETLEMLRRDMDERNKNINDGI